MLKITTPDQQKKAGFIKELLASHKQFEDLISIGAYVKGSNPKLDAAIILKDQIDDFLKQKIDEKYSFEETLFLLDDIYNKLYSNKDEETVKNDLIFE